MRNLLEQRALVQIGPDAADAGRLAHPLLDYAPQVVLGDGVDLFADDGRVKALPVGLKLAHEVLRQDLPGLELLKNKLG